MFGYTLIKKAELEAYQKGYFVKLKVLECHRWFSGWKDLDVIWDYLLGKGFGGVDYTRMMYAKERKTDEYGKPLCSPSHPRPEEPQKEVI